jgi:methionyl-tRNA formyltransferase
VKALDDLAKGSLACWPQHDAGVTYAAKIEPSETRIDWFRPAAEVQYQIQGLSPHPGAWFEIELNGKHERVRALRAALAEGKGKPGALLDGRLTIACGKGAVRLTQVQRAGKRPMGVEDFLRGVKLEKGSMLL